jgi:hypothetical protein
MPRTDEQRSTSEEHPITAPSACWSARDPRRLSCAPGFERSACLIAGDVVGVMALVLDRGEHAER